MDSDVSLRQFRFQGKPENNPLSIWERYAEDATKSDEELAEGWLRNLDNLALFAGLFSAVTTAFIIESLQLMQPDYNELNFRATVAAASGRPLPDDSFTVPSSARAVNCLWIASLLLSLSSALIALMGKDWVAEYRSPPTVHGPLVWAELRTYRLLCIKRWRMSEIIAAAPSLLHLSLITFAVGLAIFILPIDLVTGLLASALVSASGVLYAVIGLSPVIWSTSPFRTPVTNYYRDILRVTWNSSTILGLRSLVLGMSALLVALHAFLTRSRGLQQAPPSTAPAPVPALPSVESAPPLGVSSIPVRDSISNALSSLRPRFLVVPILCREARDVEATIPSQREIPLPPNQLALSAGLAAPAAALPEPPAPSDTLWDRALAVIYSALAPGSLEVQHAAGLTRGNSQGTSMDRWVVPTSDCSPSLRAGALAWLDTHSTSRDVRHSIIEYLADPESGADVAPHILSSHPQLPTRMFEEMESLNLSLLSTDRLAQYLLAVHRLRLHSPSITSAEDHFLSSMDSIVNAIDSRPHGQVTDNIMLALCVLRPGFTTVNPVLLGKMFEALQPRRSTAKIVLNSMIDHGRSSDDACHRAIFMLAAWKDIFVDALDSVEKLLRTMLNSRPALLSYCSDNSPLCRIVDLLSAFVLQHGKWLIAADAAGELLVRFAGDHPGALHPCVAAALTSRRLPLFPRDSQRVLAAIRIKPPTMHDDEFDFSFHVSVARLVAMINPHWTVAPYEPADERYLNYHDHSFPFRPPWAPILLPDDDYHIRRQATQLDPVAQIRSIYLPEHALSHCVDELFQSLTGVELTSVVYRALCDIFADERLSMLGAIDTPAWISIAYFLYMAHDEPGSRALAEQFFSCPPASTPPQDPPDYHFARYIAMRVVPIPQEVDTESDREALALFDCISKLRSVFPDQQCWSEVATLVGKEGAQLRTCLVSCRESERWVASEQRLTQFYDIMRSSLDQEDDIFTTPDWSVEELNMQSHDAVDDPTMEVATSPHDQVLDNESEGLDSIEVGSVFNVTYISTN